MLKIQRLWGERSSNKLPSRNKNKWYKSQREQQCSTWRTADKAWEPWSTDKEVVEEQIIAGPKLERQINKVYARCPGLKATEKCLLSTRGNVVFQAHHRSVIQKICVLILFWHLGSENTGDGSGACLSVWL